VRLLKSFHRPLDETVEPVWSPSYVATCVRNEARRAWRHRSTLTGSIETWAPERLDATIEVAVSSIAEGSAREHAGTVETRHRPDRPSPRIPGQVPAAFSPFQSRVIELKLAGLSIHAIATVVDRQRSQVQAAWKQVQRKLPELACNTDAVVCTTG
jgi:DNA-binding NarL/FixJ family response regulator